MSTGEEKHVMYIEINGNQDLDNFFDFLRKEFNKEHKEENLFKSADLGNLVKVEIEESGKDVKTTNVKQFICDTCGKQYKSKRNLYLHSRRHGERSFLCDYCDYAAIYKSTLTDHIRRKHTDTTPSKTCEVCGKSYKNQSSLNEHTEREHSDTPFPCDLCDQVLKSRRQLKEHKQLHGQEVTCDVCQKSFPTRHRMICHRYRNHIIQNRTGNDSKFKFVNSEDETRKRMENIGGGTWRCLLCDYKSRSTNVYRHIESRHGDGQEYECQVCQKVFKNMNAYHNHIYKAHRNK